MKPTEEQVRAKEEINDSDYDFYKCNDCGHLITKIDEIKMFIPGTEKYGRVCKCGCRKYKPCNLPWYGWFYPRVLIFAYYRIRGMI